MENKNSQKLVRDNIPRIIQCEGRKVDFYKADEDTFGRQLSLKLLEEAQEVVEAKTKRNSSKKSLMSSKGSIRCCIGIR